MPQCASCVRQCEIDQGGRRGLILGLADSTRVMAFASARRSPFSSAAVKSLICAEPSEFAFI